MNLHRRATDTHKDVDAEYVERFFGSLPKVVAQLRRGRWINLFIATFTLVAFLTVSYRTEVQQDQIKAAAQADRVSAFNQCRLVNNNALALNRFLDRVIMAVQTSPTLTAAEKAARTREYRDIKQTLPVCRRP